MTVPGVQADVSSLTGQSPAGHGDLIELAQIADAGNRLTVPLNAARSVLIQNRSNAALLCLAGYQGAEGAPFPFIVDPVCDRGVVADEGVLTELTLQDMSRAGLAIGSAGLIPRSSASSGFIIISQSQGRLGELIGAMSTSPTPAAAVAGAGGGMTQTGRVSAAGASGSVTFPTPFSTVPTVYVELVVAGTNNPLNPGGGEAQAYAWLTTGFSWGSSAGPGTADLLWAAIGS